MQDNAAIGFAVGLVVVKMSLLWVWLSHLIYVALMDNAVDLPVTSALSIALSTSFHCGEDSQSYNIMKPAVAIQLRSLFLEALIVIIAFTSITSAFTHHKMFPLCTLKNTCKSAAAMTSLYNYHNSDPEAESDIMNDGSSTSIGDVVQNLHGGKYQFSETQYLAGSSMAGQQFAESLYSGGNDGSILGEFDNEDEELPKWALRLQDMSVQSTKTILDTLTFDSMHTSHTITIKNDERSWEIYHAFILPNNGSGVFRVSPSTGSLAPRGGASNVCDETKPYSDTVDICIECTREGVGGGEENLWLFIVGTEAEAWRYCLRIV